MKIVIFIGLIILFSCDSHDKIDNPQIPDGTYTGSFQRNSVFGGPGQVAHVSITFTSDSWSSESDFPKYPALCHGKYLIENQKIIFTNECAWTAEFDWSLILGGEYDYTIDTTGLKISRDYRSSTADTYVDEYLLKKKE